MLTKEQEKLARYLIGVGYGWSRYAASVISQGWCSEKQHATMLNMKSRIEYKKNNPRSSRYSADHGGGGIGCSDSEAMASGDFF